VLKVDKSGESFEGDTQEYLDMLREKLAAQGKTFTLTASSDRRKITKDGVSIYEI